MRAQELDRLLMENVVWVRFTKKTTGTLRTMCCTKSPRLLGNALARRALGFTPPAG